MTFHQLHRPGVLVALMLLAGTAREAVAVDEFINLGAPAALAGASAYSVRPNDVSNDGGVVVGSSFGNFGGNFVDVGFRWTPAGGFEDITGSLPANDRASAYGVSDDGTVVVGDYTLPGTFDSRGFHLTGTTVTVIEPLPGGTFVRISGVSGDGRFVVGYSGDNNGIAAFRWDSTSSALLDLGNLGGDAQAFATNTDGSVVVGGSFLANLADGSRAFRWTAAGMQNLGLLAASGSSSAFGVSADGGVVVGESASATNPGFSHAFRWTADGGMVDIHGFAGDFSSASAVSGDGLVVVGSGAAGAGDLETTAFRWTATTGMQTIEDWLAASGVSVASGTVTREATATNGNGTVVVGTLRSGDAFLARAGDPGAGGSGSGSGGGLIGIADFVTTLGQTRVAAGQMAVGATVALQGAHSRPLSRRVAAGRNFFRVAGDWGEDHHGTRNGDLSLAELSAGRNFGDFQFNLSVGYSTAFDDQGSNGKANSRGGFVHGEWLFPVLQREADGLWAVAAAFHQWGETDLRRGYLNANLPDSSSGSPDNRVWGLGFTLEWDSLVTAAGVALSPYVNYTHVDTSLDAYTERGGGFPAAFGEQSEKLNEVRYGVNAERPILSAARLVASLEGVHRFEDEGAAINATLLGPGGFSVRARGRRYEQDWVRGGAGVEVGAFGGTASLMANATSEGEAPAWWLAASWRTSF